MADDHDAPKRVAYFHVTYEVLAAALGLPDGCHIRRVTEGGIIMADSVAIVIEGPDLPPVLPGAVMTQRTPQYELVDGKPRFAGWR